MSELEKKIALIPPPELVQYVGGDFQKVGKEFIKHFIQIGSLKSNETVLDVGCGVGRMAVPLMNYLGDDGAYYGFDLFKDGITWCKNNISTTRSNFHFEHIDIYNQFYNPNRKRRCFPIRFPYEDESFDFIFLTSVFTHLLPKELEHYVSEIVRVLKKDGRCFITFFLINPESSYYLNSGLSTLDFTIKLRIVMLSIKIFLISLLPMPEENVHTLLNKYGLEVTNQPHYGSWCGRMIIRVIKILFS